MEQCIGYDKIFVDKTGKLDANGNPIYGLYNIYNSNPDELTEFEIKYIQTSALQQCILLEEPALNEAVTFLEQYIGGEEERRTYSSKLIGYRCQERIVMRIHTGYTNGKVNGMKRKIIFWRILEVVFTLIWIAIFICGEMIDFENMDAELCLGVIWYGMFLMVLASWCISMGTQVYQTLKNQGCKGDIFARKDFWVSVLVWLFLRFNLCLRIYILINFIFDDWRILGGLYDCIAIHVTLILGWLLCEFLFARQKYFIDVQGKNKAKKFAAGLAVLVIFMGVSIAVGMYMYERREHVFMQELFEHHEQQEDLPWNERIYFHTDYRGRD